MSVVPKILRLIIPAYPDCRDGFSRSLAASALLLPLIPFLLIGSPLQGEPVRLEAGRPAPLFRLPDLQDREFSLESLTGKQRIVVILFWGVWCPFCREIMVRLRDLYPELHPEGLEIVAVSMRESPRKVRMFIDKLRPAYPVLVDEWAELQESYEIKDVPRIVILDGDLTVLATRITTCAETMETMIRKAAAGGMESGARQSQPDTNKREGGS